MADTKISALTAASAAAAANEFAINEAGTSKKVTGTQVKTFVSDSPTLVTPTLGVATATSVNKVAITAPATSATLTIANSATLTVSASATISSGTHSGTNTGDQTSVSGNAGTVTTNANLTGPVTSSGNATTIKKDHSVLIMAPVATDDIPLHRFDVAATLVKVVYTIAGTTNWVGQIQEANDGIGTSAANTQAADSTVTTTTTVTSFSNTSFDAGDFAYLHTTSVSGTPTFLHITFNYTEP